MKNIGDYTLKEVRDYCMGREDCGEGCKFVAFCDRSVTEWPLGKTMSFPESEISAAKLLRATWGEGTIVQWDYVNNTMSLLTSEGDTVDIAETVFPRISYQPCFCEVPLDDIIKGTAKIYAKENEA